VDLGSILWPSQAKRFKSWYSQHGRWQRVVEEAVAPLIFIDGADKVEGSIMILFFGLVFPVAPFPPGNFSADALDSFPA